MSLNDKINVYKTNEQELEKYTKEIQISISREPDIIFTNKKGETIAIEVETGLSYKKNKTELINKFQEIELQYKKRLYIVLTNSDFRKRYKNTFPKIKIISRQSIPEIISKQF